MLDPILVTTIQGMMAGKVMPMRKVRIMRLAEADPFLVVLCVAGLALAEVMHEILLDSFSSGAAMKL